MLNTARLRLRTPISRTRKANRSDAGLLAVFEFGMYMRGVQHAEGHNSLPSFSALCPAETLHSRLGELLELVCHGRWKEVQPLLQLEGVVLVGVQDSEELDHVGIV